MSVAKTINEQLSWSIDKWVYFSWGVRKKVAMVYNNMPTLALRVSGAIHKGWVYISLDEGSDTYEIALLNVAQDKVKKVVKDVYCENVGSIVDGLIERAPEMSAEEYKKKAFADSEKKMQST